MKTNRFIYPKLPVETARIANALHDAVISAEKNQLVVYYSGGSHWCALELLKAAAGVPTSLGHLVQVPRDTADNPQRHWNYCIQRA